MTFLFPIAGAGLGVGMRAGVALAAGKSSGLMDGIFPKDIL